MKTLRILAVGAIVAATIRLAATAGDAPQEIAPATPPVVKSIPPEVTGSWTGIWGRYSPSISATLKEEDCKALDCDVVRTDAGDWQATFHGECGRPYRFKITMDGRQAGETVMFNGTADLGEQDGGEFDWVGRATDQEFVGFFTSAHYTGAFQLRRIGAESNATPTLQASDE